MPYESIKAVLCRIDDDYSRAYAVAIACAEEFPDDVNLMLAGVLEKAAKQDYDQAAKFVEDAVDFCYQISVK